MTTVDVLESPITRRNVWSMIATTVFREALKRPWRKVRWEAWIEAEDYAKMDVPPRTWPDDISPLDRPGW